MYTVVTILKTSDPTFKSWLGVADSLITSSFK